MLKSVLALAVAGMALTTTVQADYINSQQHPKFINSNVNRINLVPIGTYETGLFDESAAEIVAHDPKAQLLYISNANDQSIDVVSIRNPRNPKQKFSIDMSNFGNPNSVAVKRGIVAVAVEGEETDALGQVIFFNRWGKFLNAVNVGVLPDMVTFTPDGSKVLTANEAEPDDAIDPEGSISIIDLSGGIKNLSEANVSEATFTAFNGQIDELRAQGVRIFGPDASVAQDLEPEYIAVSDDSQTAWVTLQENNALAIVDINSSTITDVVPLGTKDHSVVQNAFDASDRDDSINIRPWPVRGMYQPDTITAYSFEGQTFLVTANEGDARGFEEERVKDLVLDPALLADNPDLQQDEQLGRLEVTNVDGDTDNDGDIDVIHAFGSRSFSIWNAAGELVYDSGSDIGRITAAVSPELFNANNDENEADARSDAKGAEPEGIAVGKAYGRTFAFVGLERTGGIMTYDVSNPLAPRFVQYVNNRNVNGDPAAGTAGDLGPEGLLFISARKEPDW